jgi:hypothetical protein
MYEASVIIRMNIMHYQELLKLFGTEDKRRSTVIQLLAEAQTQLPLAVAEESAQKIEACEFDRVSV